MTPFQQITNLLETFVGATIAFNSQDLRTYEGLLDDDVVINHIHDPLGIDAIRGIADVKNYLNSKLATDKPQFIPLQPISVDIRSGIVSGSATWDDVHRGVRSLIQVDYRFIFKLDPDRGWRIFNLSASPRS
jgi:hypothetical protein